MNFQNSRTTVFRPLQRQQGAALVTALVFLIIITAIALSSMRSSTQELRMAVNAEEKLTAGQLAQALADAISANPGATPVVGEVGRRVCTPLVGANEACDDYSLPVPVEVDALIPAGGQRFVAVERINPEIRPCPGHSMVAFGCAAFRVHSQYEGGPRRGRADVYEGVLVAVLTN